MYDNELNEKVSEHLFNSREVVEYTPRSDLLQLKISKKFYEIVNRLDTFLDNKKYFIEPFVIFDIPKRMFNLEKIDLHVWTYQNDNDWRKFYSKSSNSINGVIIDVLLDENHLQQYIYEKMQKIPYVYYRNGMIVANSLYFDACWNM